MPLWEVVRAADVLWEIVRSADDLVRLPDDIAQNVRGPDDPWEGVYARAYRVCAPAHFLPRRGLAAPRVLPLRAQAYGNACGTAEAARQRRSRDRLR